MPILRLQPGYEAVVHGWVRSTERRLVLISGMTRRVYIVVTHVTDGSGGSLEIEWINRRNDVPDGLYTSALVAVRGVPKRIEWRQGFRRLHIWRLADPEIIAAHPSEGLHRTAGIDAPLPIYEDAEPDLPSGRISFATAEALQAIWPVPSFTDAQGHEVSGEVLGAVLKALHDPFTIEERDYGWEHRDWAIRVLRSLQPTRPAMPQPRLIKTPSDAERYARDVLEALGFTGVTVTPAGRDGGVDVRGREVVAQVKLEGIKTDAPRLQALSGVASHEQRQAAFFSLAGYTASAIEWAEKVGMALFEFDYGGGLLAPSSAARHLQAWGGGLLERDA